MAELALLIDLIGHIGYGFLFFGTFLIKKKSRAGWALRFIGEAIWIVLGISLGLTSIWFWSIAFIINDIDGFIKWHKSPSANG